MAGFAPVYYHESNNAWLNDLIGDIINPNHQVQQDQVFEDDVEPHLSTSDSDHESTTFTWSPRPHRQSLPPTSYPRASPTSRRRSPSYNHNAHYSYRSGSRNSQIVPVGPSHRSTPVQSLYSQQIPEVDGPLALDPFHRSASRFSTELSRESAISQKSLLADQRNADIFAGSSSTGSSTIYPKRSSSLQTVDRPRSGQDERTRDIPSRTSLGRTYSDKRLSELLYKPPLARIASNATEDFAGFVPHPAVRPFTNRDKLGEAAGPHEDDDHIYPGPFALALIVIGICLSVFIISVDRSIVTTAIPQITETFRSYSDIGWYGSAYFLTASAFQPLYGRVYMSFDTRWTFLAALGIFELGSLLGGVSPNSDVLILGRAVQGLGSAGILTGSFVVGTHSVPLRSRPVLFAFVGILYGVGALAGPLLGGVFTDLLTWRWAFWINLPVGAVTFVSVFFFFRPRKNRNQDERPAWFKRILALDLVGNAILLGACVMLFLALQLSETRGSWNNAPVIGLLSGFGATIVVFIAWLLYRGDAALIPPRIVRQRTVAASCGAAFFLYGGLLIHAYYLPIWFQAIRGDSAIHSGVNMIPYMLANALFSLMAGIFVSKNGLFAPPAIIGTAIGTVGCGLLATVNENTGTGKWIGYEILVSAGLGMAIQQGFSAVQTALPLEEVPIGTAAVVASQSLGGAIFVSIGNTILQDHLLDQNADQAIPGVNIRAVFEMGATMFRSFVPADKLPALIRLYNESLQGVFIAAVPLIGCAFLCSLCMEWKSVKTKQDLAKKHQEIEKA